MDYSTAARLAGKAAALTVDDSVVWMAVLMAALTVDYLVAEMAVLMAAERVV